MLPGALLGLLASVLALAHAVQLPLNPSHRWQAPHGDDSPTQWSLDKLPELNTTDHLVFETVYSLLQHWPNMYMLNGHNIVPGIILEGTLLYHATDRERLPQRAEWVSLDPEHAYHYCRKQTDLRSSQPGCWLLTLATTRPLRVLYFDGKSASKNPRGPLDTQDLLAWGESLPEHSWDESERAERLCEWKTSMNLDVDGFVRTEMSFEVILCDFTAGTSVVSFLNIVRVSGEPMDFSRRFIHIEALHAGSWHNHFPGETRVRLDLAGLVSFYDPELAPSLVAVRASQYRWDYRVRDVSKDDLAAVVSRLQAALSRPSGLSSGIDWQIFIQVIVDRYSGRLELARHLLTSSAISPDEILDLAVKTQIQLRIMLTPYLRVSAVPTDSANKYPVDWTAPVYKDCATTHMKFASSKLGSMTDSEKLLLRAVRGTNQEICRVVTKMWAAGVYAGIDPLLDPKDSVDTAEVARVLKVWAEDLNGLMAWLDWSLWIKCKPSCGPEEICILHKWPLIGAPALLTRESENYIAGSERGWPQAMAEESSGPQPRCISLVDPQ